MRLPTALQRFQTRLPADAQAATDAVRSSLDLLSVTPDRISLPSLATVYRAPVGTVDFSLFLTGRRGVFKTALAALCQQHFGAEMDVRHLPGHFASTANALEELAFAAKDALLVIDDFVLTEGASDGVLETLADMWRRGGVPDYSPERWSWRRGGRQSVAQGAGIGWLAGDDVFSNCRQLRRGAADVKRMLATFEDAEQQRWKRGSGVTPKG